VCSASTEEQGGCDFISRDPTAAQRNIEEILNSNIKQFGYAAHGQGLLGVEEDLGNVTS